MDHLLRAGLTGLSEVRMRVSHIAHHSCRHVIARTLSMGEYVRCSVPALNGLARPHLCSTFASHASE